MSVKKKINRKKGTVLRLTNGLAITQSYGSRSILHEFENGEYLSKNIKRATSKSKVLEDQNEALRRRNEHLEKLLAGSSDDSVIENILDLDELDELDESGDDLLGDDLLGDEEVTEPDVKPKKRPARSKIKKADGDGDKVVVEKV